MTDQNEESHEIDRRGTFWDWPTKWILVGVALLLLGGLMQAYGFVALGWASIIFGGVSTAIRRGAFTPRGRDGR